MANKVTAVHMVKQLLASGVDPRYIKLIDQLTEAERKECGL